MSKTKQADSQDQHKGFFASMELEGLREITHKLLDRSIEIQDVIRGAREEQALKIATKTIYIGTICRADQDNLDEDLEYPSYVEIELTPELLKRALAASTVREVLEQEEIYIDANPAAWLPATQFSDANMDDLGMFAKYAGVFFRGQSSNGDNHTFESIAISIDSLKAIALSDETVFYLNDGRTLKQDADARREVEAILSSDVEAEKAISSKLESMRRGAGATLG